MASEIRVDKINSLSGVGTVTLSPTGIDIAGITTSTTFVGALTGNVTGTASGNPTLSGGVDNRVVTSSSATTLTGESNVNINGGILIAGHTVSTTVSNGEGPFLQVKGPDSRGGASFIRHSADAAGCGLYIGKSRNATIGSNTIVQDDDELGRITFSGDDGTDIHTEAAKIVSAVDGTPGANDMPGRLMFYTTPDGAASPLERIRINSNGSVNMHNTSGYNTYSVDISNAGATDTGVQIRPNDGNAGEAQLFIGGGGVNQNKCAIIFDPAGGYCRGNLHFCMDNTGDTSNVDSTDKKLTVKADGNVEINSGNLVIGTSGRGIDFSATSDASGMTNELLDDYEEGTWTATVTDGGSAFGTNNASYVKIGKMVTLSFDLINNSGGNIYQVFGLPFAVAQYAAFNIAWISNNSQGAQGASDIQGGLITTSSNQLGFRVAGGNNSINVADGVRFIGSGTYETS